MFIPTSVLECIYLILCVSFLRLISGSELYLTERKNATSEERLNIFLDDLNERLEFLESCRNINFNVSVVTNSKIYSVEVSFVISDPKFRDCYEYSKITLEKKRRIIDHAQVNFTYNVEESISYEFKNVACGIYGLTIRPCYNTWNCAPFIRRYPEPINMTSNECIGLGVSKKLYIEKSAKVIFVITPVFFIIMIFILSGLISCYYMSVKSKYKQKNITYQNRLHYMPVLKKYDDETVVSTGGEKLIDIIDKDITVGNTKLIDKTLTKNTEVYILHYYNRNGVNKRKVKVIKDFLLASGYYNSVRTIEDELSVILFDMNNWINMILKREETDGKIRKIILIASEEDDKEYEYELENLIFSELIDKVNDNIEQCCKGYDHLFVVQLDSMMNYSEKLKNIVRRVRFSLTEELLDDHLINLCLNLYSGSKLNMSAVEADLRELLSKHCIRY